MQFQADEPPRSQASQTNRLLPLPVEQLGSAFSHFVETNFFARFKPELKPAPRPRLPDPVFVVVEAPTSSVIQLRGELARRQLLTEQVLSPVASADMLGNSVVQVLVDDAGRVISTTLSKSSGDTKADQLALDLARRSLFDPVGRVPVQPQPASSVP
jgi:TonB family protein